MPSNGMEQFGVALAIDLSSQAGNEDLNHIAEFLPVEIVEMLE